MTEERIHPRDIQLGDFVYASDDWTTAGEKMPFLVVEIEHMKVGRFFTVLNLNSQKKSILDERGKFWLVARAEE